MGNTIHPTGAHAYARFAAVATINPTIAVGASPIRRARRPVSNDCTSIMLTPVVRSDRPIMPLDQSKRAVMKYAHVLGYTAVASRHAVMTMAYISTPP